MNSLVKELEWEAECCFHCDELWEARSPVGRYQVFKRKDEQHYRAELEDGPHLLEDVECDTAEEAMRACQSDLAAIAAKLCPHLSAVEELVRAADDVLSIPPEEEMRLRSYSRLRKALSNMEGE